LNLKILPHGREAIVRRAVLLQLVATMRANRIKRASEISIALQWRRQARGQPFCRHSINIAAGYA
jgi:hypothetical protein